MDSYNKMSLLTIRCTYIENLKATKWNLIEITPVEDISINSLPNLLISEKKKLNITQKQLSEKIGISEVSISMYINGMFPTQTRNLKKIAKYFNMSMEELDKLRLD